MRAAAFVSVVGVAIAKVDWRTPCASSGDTDKFCASDSSDLFICLTKKHSEGLLQKTCADAMLARSTESTAAASSSATPKVDWYSACVADMPTVCPIVDVTDRGGMYQCLAEQYQRSEEAIEAFEAKLEAQELMANDDTYITVDLDDIPTNLLSSECGDAILARQEQAKEEIGSIYLWQTDCKIEINAMCSVEKDLVDQVQCLVLNDGQLGEDCLTALTALSIAIKAEAEVGVLDVVEDTVNKAVSIDNMDWYGVCDVRGDISELCPDLDRGEVFACLGSELDYVSEDCYVALTERTKMAEEQNAQKEATDEAAILAVARASTEPKTPLDKPKNKKPTGKAVKGKRKKGKGKRKGGKTKRKKGKAITSKPSSGRTIGGKETGRQIGGGVRKPLLPTRPQGKSTLPPAMAPTFEP